MRIGHWPLVTGCWLPLTEAESRIQKPEARQSLMHQVKLEEYARYIIGHDERIEELEKENKELKEDMEILKKEVEELKKKK